MIETDKNLSIDMAPVPDLARFLALLSEALATIRACGFSDDKDLATFSGYVADALHNLPRQLLNYREFDQPEFWRYIGALRTQVPPHLAPHWDALFHDAINSTG